MAKRTTVDISEVTKGLTLLGSAKESLARTMGAAMGNVVRDEAKIRAPVLKPGNEGTDNQQAGLLRDSIYNAYDKRRHILNPNIYRYTVSWNSTRAPHGHLAEFGHWMPYEYAITADGLYTTPLLDRPQRGTAKGIPLPGGGIWIDAQPFLGPAFDAKLSSLLTVATNAATMRFPEVVK
jgi:hypothetical protein